MTSEITKTAIIINFFFIAIIKKNVRNVKRVAYGHK